MPSDDGYATFDASTAILHPLGFTPLYVSLSQSIIRRVGRLPRFRIESEGHEFALDVSVFRDRGMNSDEVCCREYPTDPSDRMLTKASLVYND